MNYQSFFSTLYLKFQKERGVQRISRVHWCRGVGNSEALPNPMAVSGEGCLQSPEPVSSPCELLQQPWGQWKTWQGEEVQRSAPIPTHKADTSLPRVYSPCDEWLQQIVPGLCLFMDV